MKMKCKYDRDGDTLDILIREEQVHHAEDYGEIIINYDENNRLVEIEVLNASRFFGGLLTEMIQAKPEVNLVEITQ
jgi:uncharacterized protein YuzE